MPRNDDPSIVVLTMARDEGPMLARWIRHYADQVGADNLVIFDDHTGDGSTEGLAVTVHHLPTLPGGKQFGAVRTRLLNGIAQGLLECYDVAVFTDVDEFLVPDPAVHGGLGAYLAARADADVLAPIALNVLHDQRIEPALVDGRPVLDQRSFAKFVPRMCKPSIKRIKAPWRFQGHGIAAPFAVDPELFMIHLKFADAAALRTVADRRRAVFDADGRGPASSWTQPGADLVAQLPAFVGAGDPAWVPELDVAQLDLDAVVRHVEDGSWSTMQQTQVKAMITQPLVRIPQRLLGAV